MRLWLRRCERAPHSQAGGKAKVADQLVSLIPGGEEYREPFAGSAAVFFELRKRDQFNRYWLNDKNPGVVALLTALRDNAEGLAETVLEVREEFDDHRRAHAWSVEVLRKVDPNPIMMGAAHYICSRTTYASQGITANYTPESAEKFSVQHVERLPLFGPLLKEVKITRGDFAPLLAGEGKSVFVYCDPPYPVVNRVQFLGHRQFDRKRFHDLAKVSPHRVLVTEAESAEKSFSDWHCFRRPVAYHVWPFPGPYGFVKHTAELVAMNYPDRLVGAMARGYGWNEIPHG